MKCTLTLPLLTITGLFTPNSAFISKFGGYRLNTYALQTKKTYALSSLPVQADNFLTSVTTQLATDVPESLDRNPVPIVIEKPKVSGTPMITKITNTKEFLDFIEGDDRLCVIKFHANWCQICRTVVRKFAKFALNFGDREIIDGTSSGAVVPGSVRFADVEWSQNTELCKALKVKKFPFIMIYEKSEKIGAFSTGPAHNFRNIVGKTIEEKLAMSDDEKEQFRTKFATNIAEAMDDLEIIRGFADDKNVADAMLRP